MNTQDTKRITLPFFGATMPVEVPVPIRLGDPAWERQVHPMVREAVEARYCAQK
ncbi:hypothetical protein [Caballeronia sp. LZ032]|uniref:hypothetical protein n=1 Tax=Caballeronia sp. LZ032 TaxID=3038565 RepID=UPI00285B977D|nr:hypothetical protein [Caballeronia sp. LZ032]MDR5879050.1 hypothetical protein [Caballeronia sp. LZ032]